MKILVGLSGGLDSTFAAHLLIEEGHEVVGAAVLMHGYTDVRSAETAAKQLGIPLVTIDRREEFDREIIGNFADEYAAGRTPNPCILCNPLIKFGALCDYAEENGFDRIATGHYAYICRENGRYFVREADDGKKDQSYVLYRLDQKQLSMLLLPLSGLKKSDIRAEAVKLGYSAAKAEESLDVCFLPDGNYSGFVTARTGKTFPEGDFVDENGKKLGRHSGLINYTVGQRKGLGNTFGRPMFVRTIDAGSNTVTVVPSGGEYFSKAYIDGLCFMKITPEMLTDEYPCSVKVRYSAKKAPCRVKYDGNGVRVTFDEPVRAVAPGQSAVFYDGEDVLFGGFIRDGE